MTVRFIICDTRVIISPSVRIVQNAVHSWEPKTRKNDATNHKYSAILYLSTDRYREGSGPKRQQKRRSSWIVTWYQHLLVQGSQPYIWNV